MNMSPQWSLLTPMCHKIRRHQLYSCLDALLLSLIITHPKLELDAIF
jgi:hypothetical protein